MKKLRNTSAGRNLHWLYDARSNLLHMSGDLGENPAGNNLRRSLCGNFEDPMFVAFMGWTPICPKCQALHDQFSCLLANVVGETAK